MVSGFRLAGFKYSFTIYKVTLGKLLKLSMADIIIPYTKSILYVFSSAFFLLTEPSHPNRGKK